MFLIQNVVIFKQKWFYSDKSFYIWAKVVVFGEIGSIRANRLFIGQGGCFLGKVVVFRQKWLYRGKSGCIGTKVVVFEQIGVIREKWMYSGKVVVLGQKWLY